jgi:hypothetical protein
MRCTPAVNEGSLAASGRGRRSSVGRQGIHIVAPRLAIEELLQFFQLLRILGGQIVRLAVVLVQIVKFPRILFGAVLIPVGELADLPGQQVARSGPPSVLVNAAVAQHFEVLNLVGAGLVRMIEAIDHADAFERQLFHAVDHVRKLHAGQFIERGRDIGDVMELRAQSAGVLDVSRPGDDQRIARAAQVGSHLLAPLKWRALVAHAQPPHSG